MTWQEKFAAIDHLSPVSLRMRRPGDWYVSAPRRLVYRLGHPTYSGSYGTGVSPEAAVEADWRLLTEPGLYAVISAEIAYGAILRLFYQWDGSGWVERPDPTEDEQVETAAPELPEPAVPPACARPRSAPVIVRADD